MKPVSKGKFDDAITRSFRDVADGDYIAARVCWKCQLDHQFFWLALQAIEKYLKGILLFHRESAKGLGHDLSKALERIKTIPRIDLKLDPKIEQFIEILSCKGPNRYFEWNLNRNGNELLWLDKTVWHLRIHCVAINSSLSVRPPEDSQFTVIWTSQEHFEKIKRYQPNQNPSMISIPYGKLETVLAAKSEAKEALIWKNFYFGFKHKKSIQWKEDAHYSSPVHVIAPEVFSELEKLVDFSRETKTFFQSGGKNPSSKMPAGFFQLAGS